jgi:hypothetical protein
MPTLARRPAAPKNVNGSRPAGANACPLCARPSPSLRAGVDTPPTAIRVPERVPGDPDAARVVLVAEEPGTVRVALVIGAGCAPPLRSPVAAGPTGQREPTRPPLAGAAVAMTVRMR